MVMEISYKKRTGKKNWPLDWQQISQEQLLQLVDSGIIPSKY